MSFKVILLEQAEADVDHILDWLCQRSVAGAMTWDQCWNQVLKRLAEFADGQGIAPEDADHESRIQDVPFKTRYGGTYRALFTIRDDKVYVLAVRGPGQDLVPPDELPLPEDG